MKLLSDAAEYGLRAAVWLARQRGQTRKVREIAEGTKAPPGYLIKVLQSLAKAGILSAQRGTLGGFTLERDPAQLTVLEVINAIDPVERISTCPLGYESHGTDLCPMHRQIDEAMARIEESFSAVTVADLLTQPNGSSATCLALSGAGRVDLRIDKN
ncbi:MAG: Rrf2 family transcriptional regulator [Phycisphaerales bacterium]|nr:Rrf2 family transcriptional regulator [Phycisphaerales bacterium]